MNTSLLHFYFKFLFVLWQHIYYVTSPPGRLFLCMRLAYSIILTYSLYIILYLYHQVKFLYTFGDWSDFNSDSDWISFGVQFLNLTLISVVRQASWKVNAETQNRPSQGPHLAGCFINCYHSSPRPHDQRPSPTLTDCQQKAAALEQTDPAHRSVLSPWQDALTTDPYPGRVVSIILLTF